MSLVIIFRRSGEKIKPEKLNFMLCISTEQRIYASKNFV